MRVQIADGYAAAEIDSFESVWQSLPVVDRNGRVEFRIWGLIFGRDCEFADLLPGDDDVFVDGPTRISIPSVTELDTSITFYDPRDPEGFLTRWERPVASRLQWHCDDKGETNFDFELGGVMAFPAAFCATTIRVAGSLTLEFAKSDLRKFCDNSERPRQLCWNYGRITMES